MLFVPLQIVFWNSLKEIFLLPGQDASSDSIVTATSQVSLVDGKLSEIWVSAANAAFGLGVLTDSCLLLVTFN